MTAELLTADEVAERLRVTRAWILAEARAGRLAHDRLNRKVRFTWEQVEAFLAARRPLRREATEREILSPDELAVVLDAAEGQYALLLRMAALLGLRRGELLGLRWDDLELERRRLHVRQTYTNTGFGSPKSRAGRRVVPLTPGIVRDLRRHRLGAPSNEHGLVFASSADTPIDPLGTS